jgi:nucleoside-diphosphate-sugar epimerase
MKKIVITGGLGYIGSELCKIYSGEARFKNITVIDNRFISERVKQLRDWGINFIQASILDEEVMKEQLNDADTIIHLAGVTDVAYVKTQANKEQDNQIKVVGIDGTKNIIKYANKNAKIIFPSTHVVYEGFSETKSNIIESEPTCPILTYGQGKSQSEIDLIESGANHVILRLASVYGYSTDTMRMGIMPNLFSKIASQNGTIKLFSGGVQLKSLVPLIDVARCMKFMAENGDINKETFHVALDTITVKEVAELCKEINPKLTLIETDDEIPNLGYTISNEKLLSTGFTFRYNLKDSLEEMITNWSANDIIPDLEYTDKGGNEYIDNRGEIRNYELTEPINLIGCIDSKKGTVRANHYHPIQEQKCLLIKGQYISVIKDLSYPDAPIETRVINEGDIAIIKPNVAHTMVFTEDSIFLNLVRGEREHENYGITHTIPYILVDEPTRVKLLESYRTDCRSCGSIDLKKIISLGNSPLANNLKNTANEAFETYPLEMNYCPKCHNCQLSITVPPQKMFDNYLYVSSTAASFRKHFEDIAEKYITEFGLNEETLVIDIGSNDGIALKPLQENNIKVLGVEPAVNIAKIANDDGIPTYNSYFNSDTVTEIIKTHGRARLVTASNVFAHSDELVNITNEAFNLLEDDGTFIVEVQYLLDTMIDLTFDNIYHEHVNYWSVTSINNFFDKLNLSVYKVERINTHGGSIRVYIKRNGVDVDSSVEQFINAERLYGLTDFKTYKYFGDKVAKLKNNVKKNMSYLKSKYNTIAGYGSPAKATTSLNYFGINNNDINYIIEDNIMKNGKFIPGVNIPIHNKEYCMNNLPEIIIVLAWNFFEDIKRNNQELIEMGVIFVNIKDLQNNNFLKKNFNDTSRINQLS